MTQLIKCGEYTQFAKNTLHRQHDIWYTIPKYHLQEGIKMSIQRLHAFEKTSIQARHTIKRLEGVIYSTHTTEDEKVIARELLKKFQEIRDEIPEDFQDVDLNKE